MSKLHINWDHLKFISTNGHMKKVRELYPSLESAASALGIDASEVTVEDVEIQDTCFNLNAIEASILSLNEENASDEDKEALQFCLSTCDARIVADGGWPEDEEAKEDPDGDNHLVQDGDETMKVKTKSKSKAPKATKKATKKKSK